MMVVLWCFADDYLCGVTVLMMLVIENFCTTGSNTSDYKVVID